MNYVISIINPDSLDRLSAICEELSLPLSVILHGRGTAVQSMLDLLGIESTEKRVVLSVANAEKTKALITAEKHRLHIGVPGHGIVIAVPVKSIGGGKAVAYLNGDSKLEKHAPTLNYAYELIVAIASEGSTDMVMNAARAAGARGGTVLHGKGTGAKDAPKFYNISIAEEKEMVYIVASADKRNGIMSAIMNKAGAKSPAHTVMFSLPVDAVAGIHVPDNEQDQDE